MLDIKWIRENPKDFDLHLERRAMDPLSHKILDVDEWARKSQTELQNMQAKRNDVSNQVSLFKKEGKDAQPLIQEMGDLKEAMAKKDKEAQHYHEELYSILSHIPNILDDHVSLGRKVTKKGTRKKPHAPKK